MQKTPHPNTDFFTAVRDYTASIPYDPSMDLMLFISFIAVVLAFPASALIRRITTRRLQDSVKYGNIVNSIMASVLLPFMMIVNLVAASWVFSSIFSSVQNHNIIQSLIKITFVWLAARTLLLVSHRHFIAFFIGGVMLVMTLLSVTGLLQPTQASLSEISFDTEKFHISLLDIIKGIFTMVILFWGAGVLGNTSESWLRHSQLSFNARELTIKFLRITLYFLAFLCSLTEMGVDLTALTVLGGALAVGLGFGMQKISSNFLSGIVLLFEKAIEPGDLIEVGSEKGWVRQMAIRHTLIETQDGREILVPNEDLIIGKVTNWTYTNTRARIEIPLTITYGSDVDLARKLLIEAAKGHRLCISEPPPAAHLREFSDHGIQIMLVFWIPDVTQGTTSAKSEVMLTVISSFRTSGIRFAEAIGTIMPTSKKGSGV